MSLVLSEQNGFVTTLTINRPEAMNALDTGMYAAIAKAFAAIDPKTTRCVILASSLEKVFVSGIDLAELAGMTKADGAAYIQKMGACMQAVEDCPVPVIAVMNGHTHGGGSELALACDVRLAAEELSFSMPEVVYGIVASYGISRRVVRAVGYGKARELFFTACRLNGEEALRIGLVNAVYPREQLLAKAQQMAEGIAQQAPIAVQSIKTVLNNLFAEDYEGKELPKGPDPFTLGFETQDHVNAVNAFLEKRKPEPFVGK